MAGANVRTGRESVVTKLDAATRARISGVSWHPGCPVGLDDLRLVTVTFVGFDSADHVGELIVHRSVAANVALTFDELYRAKFAFARIRLVDDFGADDDRSTLANNTSAFNCRAAEGSTRWSAHAYGEAIDINPLQNPYVYADGHVLDPAAKTFVDRSKVRTGMITTDGPVVKAFARIGWGWGGRWRTTKDYQHVSARGH